jgi:hypothetical protein
MEASRSIAITREWGAAKAEEPAHSNKVGGRREEEELPVNVI